MRKSMSLNRNESGYQVSTKVKESSPLKGELVIQAGEDVLVYSENYVHPRIAKYFLSNAVNEPLYKFLGIKAGTVFVDSSLTDKPGINFSVENVMKSIVLAKCTHKENPALDDSILEAQSIVAVASTFRDVSRDGMLTTPYPWGKLNTTLSSMSYGELTLVYDFEGDSELEFDTVYLTNGVLKDTPKESIYLPSLHPANSQIKFSLTNIEYAYTTSHLRGSRYHFYEEGKAKGIVSTGSGTFFFVDISLMPVENNDKPRKAEPTVTRLSPSDLFPDYRYNSLGVSLSGKQGSYWYMVTGLCTDDMSSVPEVYPMLVKLSDSGSVLSKVNLEKPGMGVNLVTDSVVHSNRLYILGTQLSTYDGYTREQNTRLELMIYEYTLEGSLVGTHLITTAVRIKPWTKNDTFSYPDISTIYMLKHDLNNELLISSKKISDNLEGGLKENVVFRFNLDTKDVSTDTLYQDLAYGSPIRPLSYNKFNNKFYYDSTTSSTYVGGNYQKEQTLMPMSIAPILTKNKLPAMVKKPKDKNLRLTYKLSMGDANI